VWNAVDIAVTKPVFVCFSIVEAFVNLKLIAELDKSKLSKTTLLKFKEFEKKTRPGKYSRADDRRKIKHFYSDFEKNYRKNFNELFEITDLPREEVVMELLYKHSVMY